MSAAVAEPKTEQPKAEFQPPYVKVGDVVDFFTGDPNDEVQKASAIVAKMGTNNRSLELTVFRVGTVPMSIGGIRHKDDPVRARESHKPFFWDLSDNGRRLLKLEADVAELKMIVETLARDEGKPEKKKAKSE